MADADGARPASGWVPVTLPDQWINRWPDHDGSVWYRIDWQPCPSGEPSLGIDGMSMAGEVYLNQDLLWRDASMVEPLSRSWNQPRWWVLPRSALHEGVNAVWVRVVGLSALSPGLGALRLNTPQVVADHYSASLWRQRTLYGVNAVFSGVAAGLFLLVWCMRREEQAYGWFGLMALCWAIYLTAFLAETPWPFADSMTKARANLVALLLYVGAACMFTFRFGGQRMPWVERGLLALLLIGLAVTCFVPEADARTHFTNVWLGALVMFFANSVQFQWHAWFPRQGKRQWRHMLLALCWLVFVVIALHDLSLVMGIWAVARSWASMSGPLIVALMMMLLAGNLAQRMTDAERFNQALAHSVAQARTELTQALDQAHTHALDHAKLQERMQIAHDLHDGLGSSLVRGMALVEQSAHNLSHARVLSLLKNLRDDLRQVIDHGSSAGASVPETPVQWMAPLRHRFTQIFDEIGIRTEWSLPPSWPELGGQPTALQCLGMTRVVEESLSNVIKHSHARHVRVVCAQTRDGLTVRIEDDGTGFDVAAVQQAGQSVGMRSMAARAERIGGLLEVSSGVCGSVVMVTVHVKEGPGNAA